MAKSFLILTLTAIAALSFTAACELEDPCTPEDCAELGEGFNNNGRTYQKCISCFGDGTCNTTLIDDDDEVFFECDDEPGATCTEASVNAQFGYCEIG